MINIVKCRVSTKKAASKIFRESIWNSIFIRIINKWFWKKEEWQRRQWCWPWWTIKVERILGNQLNLFVYILQCLQLIMSLELSENNNQQQQKNLIIIDYSNTTYLTSNWLYILIPFFLFYYFEDSSFHIFKIYFDY